MRLPEVATFSASFRAGAHPYLGWTASARPAQYLEAACVTAAAQNTNSITLF